MFSMVKVSLQLDPTVTVSSFNSSLPPLLNPFSLPLLFSPVFLWFWVCFSLGFPRFSCFIQIELGWQKIYTRLFISLFLLPLHLFSVSLLLFSCSFVFHRIFGNFVAVVALINVRKSQFQQLFIYSFSFCDLDFQGFKAHANIPINLFFFLQSTEHQISIKLMRRVLL